MADERTVEEKLKDYKRRKDAGEFLNIELTEAEVNELQPCSILHAMIMTEIDPEYKDRLNQEFHRTAGLYVEGLYPPS